MQSEIMPVYRDHECPADDALRDSLGCVRPRRAALQPASSRRRWAIARWTSSNDPRSPCTAVKSSNAESSSGPIVRTWSHHSRTSSGGAGPKSASGADSTGGAGRAEAAFWAPAPGLRSPAWVHGASPRHPRTVLRAVDRGPCMALRKARRGRPRFPSMTAMDPKPTIGFAREA